MRFGVYYCTGTAIDTSLKAGVSSKTPVFNQVRVPGTAFSCCLCRHQDRVCASINPPGVPRQRQLSSSRASLDAEMIHTCTMPCCEQLCRCCASCVFRRSRSGFIDFPLAARCSEAAGAAVSGTSPLPPPPTLSGAINYQHSANDSSSPVVSASAAARDGPDGCCCASCLRIVGAQAVAALALAQTPRSHTASTAPQLTLVLVCCSLARLETKNSVASCRAQSP